MKKILSIAMIASTLLLSACLVPEKFYARVEFNDDLSYSYQFKGTTAFVPALIDKAGKRPITKAYDEKLASEGMKYKGSHSDVARLDYVGDARYETLIEGSKPAGIQTGILDIFFIGKDTQGNPAVFTKMDSKDMVPFKDLGLNIDGKLLVKLPGKARILKTNGTESKNLFGFGATSVEWVIQKSEGRPYLVFTLGK